MAFFCGNRTHRPVDSSPTKFHVVYAHIRLYNVHYNESTFAVHTVPLCGHNLQSMLHTAVQVVYRACLAAKNYFFFQESTKTVTTAVLAQICTKSFIRFTAVGELTPLPRSVAGSGVRLPERRGEEKRQKGRN